MIPPSGVPQIQKCLHDRSFSNSNLQIDVCFSYCLIFFLFFFKKRQWQQVNTFSKPDFTLQLKSLTWTWGEGQTLKNTSAQNLRSTKPLTSKHSSFMLIKVPHCNSVSGREESKDGDMRHITSKKFHVHL